jgi:GntR family transcriptional repressor for pyruvate dehydrogenase complex
MLEPIERRSLTDSVFEQLRDAILTGGYRAGSPLPSERELAAALQVNRGAVREALGRLGQLGLVLVRHGGATRVLDYREQGGLELLPALLLRADGRPEPSAIRAVMEMRSALAPDVARLAAVRQRAPLGAAADGVREAAGDLRASQAAHLTAWNALVDGSGNVAYRLAFNQLWRVYESVLDVLAGVLAPELSDAEGMLAILDAAASGDALTAAQAASNLVRKGQNALDQVLTTLEALPEVP